jgi:hypothetical protein
MLFMKCSWTRQPIFFCNSAKLKLKQNLLIVQFQFRTIEIKIEPYYLFILNFYLF